MMKKWMTQLEAIDPKTGKLVKYNGPVIKAPTKGLAQEWCDTHFLSYCTVTGMILNQFLDENGNTVTEFTKNICFTNYDLN